MLLPSFSAGALRGLSGYFRTVGLLPSDVDCHCNFMYQGNEKCCQKHASSQIVCQSVLENYVHEQFPTAEKVEFGEGKCTTLNC
jgi:hypothetical protein